MKHIFTVIFLSSISLSIFAQKHEGIVTPADYTNPVGDTLKILTWNVEHFVDAHNSPYINSDRENEATPSKVNQRIDQLVAALKKIDADVVVLQEFESQAFLQKIAEEKLPEQKYRFFASVPSPTWYMNVVVMSRVSIGAIHGYGSVTTPVKGSLGENGLPETQNRINTRMLSVEVLVNARYSFILHGVHLKAGRGARNEAMREGQIDFLLGQCARFYKEDRQTNQLILGDLNCTPESKEFQKLLKDRKGVRFIDPLADTAVMSHPADQPERRIDHILIDKNMAKELIPNSVKMATVFSPTQMRAMSDHLPVVAQFLVK